MRLVWLALCLLALRAVPALADEPPPEARAFVEIHASSERIFVGQPFTLTLRLGIDRAWFDDHVVALFRRRLDLPVQLTAPWLKAPRGARALDDDAPQWSMRLALDGREAGGVRAADVVRDGRTFEVAELSRRYLPEEVGTQPLEATLRFAHATRFEEDFLGGRIAVDREDVVVRSPPFVLRVEPVPTEGRPEAWRGGVGRYAVTATLAPAASSPAGTLALTVVIEGEGNLAFVDPPSPERLVGFHVYGLVDDRRASRRTIVYEVAPLAGTTAVPAIPFAFFNPAPPAAYRTVRTEPIPLAAPTQVPAGAEEATPRGDLPWSWLLGLTGLVLAGAAFARLRRIRAARAVGDAPRSAWSARLNAPGVDPAEVLTETLATHLGVAPAAVIGPRLGERLVTSGVEAGLADRTARTLETLVGARFGGAAAGRDETVRSQVADLLEALDVVLQRDEERGGVRP